MDEQVRPRGLPNRVVAAALTSPFHRLLSSWVCLLRYRGRRSGRPFSTPTQYVRYDQGIVILVARSEDKTWWRNFTAPGHDLDVLLEGTWQPMVGRVVTGAAEPELARRLLDAYLARFPKSSGALKGSTPADRTRQVVAVCCRPAG